MVIIFVMSTKKNVVIPAVVATFLTAWAFTGSFAAGLQSIFKASLTAAAELFNIFLIIAFVTALLGALRALGADRRMIEPFRYVMNNGHTSFWVIALVSFIISLFFWPTPAVPLIGAILFPAAVRAGLSPLAAALSMAIAGQGMALSSDYVIQVAPGLSATAAGTDASRVADYALVLSSITGLTALLLGYLMIRRTIVRPDPKLLERWEARTDAVIGRKAAAASAKPAPEPAAGPARAPEPAEVGAGNSGPAGAGATSGSGGGAGTGAAPSNPGSPVPTQRIGDPEPAPVTADDAGGGRERAEDTAEAARTPVLRSKSFAVAVPLVLIGLVVYMMLGKFTDLVPELLGNDAAALVGGVVALILLMASISLDGHRALESCAAHIVDGLIFSVKAMGVVIPIAGFFFIGNSDFAGSIMGLTEGTPAPSFLFELVTAAQGAIPSNPFVVGFSLLIIGMITGLDGSGFSGLPLTGALAGSLGPAVGFDPALLAAIGQMGSIWTGGGVLIAWSSLLAVAGFARISVIDLVRIAFFPVVAGLIISTTVAIAVF
ncbi:membrane protein [Spinactinospora alkalitolerans]